MPGILGRSTLLRNLLFALIAAGLFLWLTESLSEYRNTQLAMVAYTACAVGGLTILTGLSGQISLGNGAFMFVGAYTVALLLEHHPFVHNEAGYNNKEFVLVLVAAILVAAAIGGLVGVAAARLRGPYLAGLTLALALGLPQLPQYQHLQSKLGGHAGIPVNPPSPPQNVDLERWQAWVCGAAAIITILLLANLASSRVGRTFRAVRDDEISAALAGLPVARIQILAFVVSAGAAGLAGGLFVLVSDSVGPGTFTLATSLGLLSAAVFGGLGSLAGAVYGSALIVLLPVWATDVANKLSLSTKFDLNLPLAVYGATLVVAMLVFPYGLQGLLSRIWARLQHHLGKRVMPVG
jgi:branched-chain amino acid transport system permease protein